MSGACDLGDLLLEFPDQLPVGKPSAREHAVNQLDQVVTIYCVGFVDVKWFSEQRTSAKNR